MKRGRYTILVFAITIFHSRVLVVKLVTGLSGHPVSFGLEYLDGGGRSGGMAEYYIEIPSSPSVDRFGGGCGTFDKRFADADDFPQPLAGPSVLGISSGASLGVAFVVLLSGQLGWH